MIYERLIACVFIFYAYNVRKCFNILYKYLLECQSWNSIENKTNILLRNLEADTFGLSVFWDCCAATD